MEFAVVDAVVSGVLPRVRLLAVESAALVHDLTRENLSEIAAFMKILGSYPRDK